MRKNKKTVWLIFSIMLLLLLMPMGASAAVKKSMKTALKRDEKGYIIVAYNKKNYDIKVYCQRSTKKGYYATLEKGGAMVVDMKKVRALTKNKKDKALQWIPVYMNNMSKNGKLVTGYLYARSVELSSLNIKKLSKSQTVNTAINYGFSKLGTQYVLGGLSMDYGIDCATFVKAIYEYAGKTMPYPHTDYLQLAGYNVGLNRRNWKAGDLLFYLENDTSGPIGHVAVYLGKSLMINSSGHYGTVYPRGGVCIKRVDYGARKPVLCIRLYGI